MLTTWPESAGSSAASCRHCTSGTFRPARPVKSGRVQERQRIRRLADWQYYQALRDGTLENAPRLLNPLRGSANHYWIDDDIEILSPTTTLIADCDNGDVYNNVSYVLRISHGESSVLLPGDIEAKGSNDLIDARLDLSADVLVASHQGRKSGYSEDAMSAINPAVAIISTDSSILLTTPSTTTEPGPSMSTRPARRARCGSACTTTARSRSGVTRASWLASCGGSPPSKAPLRTARTSGASETERRGPPFAQLRARRSARA